MGIEVRRVNFQAEHAKSRDLQECMVSMLTDDHGLMEVIYWRDDEGIHLGPVPPHVNQGLLKAIQENRKD